MSIDESLRSNAIRLGVGQHKVSCPFCSQQRKKKGERTLSLRVQSEEVLYQCWHCQNSGAVKLREDYKQVKRETMTPVAPAVKKNWLELDQDAIAWLMSRGISEITARTAGVKSANHYIRSVGSETSCVVFPYSNDGQQYAAKIRAIKDKGFSCQSNPQTFFNIENVDIGDDLIVCEGEMDVLAFMEAGFKSVVSVPNGAVMKVNDSPVEPANDNKFQFLWNAKKFLDKANKIIIATDSDEAGQAMAEEIARRVGKNRCWRVSYPDDCKDANDVLVKHGKKVLENLPNKATPWPVAGLYDAEHFYDAVDDIYNNGMGKGASTGYHNVDEFYTVVEGQLTVVTGHPSSGKSEFIDQIMINMAQNDDWKFAICSFENEPRLHIAKLISKYLRKPFFAGATQRMSQHDLDYGKQFIQSHFTFLYQADGSLATIDDIIDRLKAAVMRHGVKGAIIDPYNYIQKSRDISETDWISDMLTKLRVFAQAHDIHLWFVAHPTKMLRGADGKVPVPKGYDISGSAAWFAKADIGLTVHRPDPKRSESEVHIWKCRFSWVGKQGDTKIYFDPVTSTYFLPTDDFPAPMQVPQYQPEDVPF